MLAGKSVVGISGAIAAYKTLELIRMFKGIMLKLRLFSLQMRLNSLQLLQ